MVEKFQAVVIGGGPVAMYVQLDLPNLDLRLLALSQGVL